MMVFPNPGPWKKAAHLVCVGKDIEAQEAHVEPASGPLMLWLQVVASALAWGPGRRTQVALVALKAGCMPHRTADLHLGRIAIRRGRE